MNAESKGLPGGRNLVRLSLPEIESLVVKAARGAGYNWGIAEEAGFAVRWLARTGLPGPEIMLAHLQEFDRLRWSTIAPTATGNSWSGTDGGRLCPIAAGAALSDHFGHVGDSLSDGLQIVNLANPVLLLPFISQVAKSRSVALCVNYDRRETTVDAAGWESSADSGFLANCSSATVIISQSEKPRQTMIKAERQDWPTDPDTLSGFEALAGRTYVPASDQSRAGAGSDASDND